MAANELLTENIESGKDVGEVQNQSVSPQFSNREGMTIAEWSVAGEMNRQGVEALAIGTYQLKDMNGNNVVIPDNSILSALLVRDDTVAKAGAGTITIEVQDLDGDWIALDNVLNAKGVHVADDGAGNVLVVGYKWAQDAGIRVVVTVGTVTAGAFTLFAKLVLGN